MKKLLNTLFLVLTFSLTAHAEVWFENDPSLPLVYVNIGFLSGTVDDPSGQSGITNFTGEMLLRGTKSRTKEQIDLELDQMGAQLAVETRQEALILRGAVLRSQLDHFLSLVEDIVLNPVFSEKEVRKLKSEIISEILEEQGSDSALAKKRFNSYLFGEHPYGKPIDGTQKDIQKVTIEMLKAHYSKVINKNRIFFVGTGDASEAAIQNWFKGVEKKLPACEAPQKIAAPKNSSKRRILIVDKPDRSQTQITGGQIGVLMTDPDFFPLYLGNHAFGGGSFSARLMVEIRVKRGWSYGASSSFRHGTQPRSWFFHLFPAAKDTAAALSHTFKMVDELKDKGITSDEFTFAKKSLINSSGFMYNTPKKRVENTLIEATLHLPKGFMKSYGSSLANVSNESVNRAFNRFLQPDKLSVVIVGTAKTLRGPIATALGVKEQDIEVVPYSQE